MLALPIFRRLKFVLFVSLLYYLTGCSTQTIVTQDDNYSRTGSRIDSLFNEDMFKHAHWGVLIKSLDTGRKWFEKNPNKVFMPASNEKIITASSALLNLGPQFKFETKLYYSGDLGDSVIQGDLVVWSNGDPTMYTRFYDDPLDIFHKWADILDSLGIKRIAGNIIGNDNAFDDNPLGYGWSHGGLDSWYSAEVGALQLNENYIDFKIVPPGFPEDSIKIIPNLSSSYYKIVNNTEVVDTGRSRIKYKRNPGENIIYFEGRVKSGAKEIEVSPTITNPTLFYVTVLKEVLEEKGIIIDGDPVDVDSIEDWSENFSEDNLIINHYSKELSEILRVLMKDSQNLYAETMVRVLGWKYEGEGSFPNGKKIVDSTLTQFGVKEGSYKFMDGSGLSRYNYVSPDALVKVLEGMYKSEYKDIWLDTFPIGGIDGTLENRFTNGSAFNNVKAKTGTIRNVRGLSGYVTTKEGEDVVFSFLINGHLLKSVDTEMITDKVIELIADFKN